MLRKEGLKLIVTLDGETIQEIPESEVERVVIFGNVQITTQALALLLDESIDTTFFSFSGKYRGRLMSAEQSSVLRRLKIAQLYENPNVEIPFIKAIVRAKILNSVSVLERHVSVNPDDVIIQAVSTLKQYIDNLDSHNDLNEILGVEGSSARVFFSGLGFILDTTPKFTARQRPALDPVNSCLNLGYTMLTSEMTGALYSAGFDPYIGICHKVHPGRPSLSLDLVEEFRHVIDRLVLVLFNKKQLNSQKHFETDDQGSVRLNKDGRKVFFTEYERLLKRPVRDIDGTNSPPRRRFHEQCDRLASFIMSDTPYKPFIWKE